MVIEPFRDVNEWFNVIHYLRDETVLAQVYELPATTPFT